MTIKKFFTNLFRTKEDRTSEENSSRITQENIKKQMVEAVADRDKSEEENRNFVLSGFEIVKAIELKPQDVIIHNYAKFKISDCGCGYGAGNEFGDYFWIKGSFVNGNPTDPKPLKDFWSAQRCPMIRVKNEQS